MIKSNITLSQSRYIELVSKKFRMLDCNPSNTPMEQNLKINSCENENLRTNKLLG